MKSIATKLICFHFLLISFSALWGDHIHHTDSHEQRSHKEDHSERAHHHEEARSVIEQDHCIEHCSVETLLEHVLENRTFLRLGNSEIDHNNQELIANTFYPPISIGSDLFFHFVTTIPPPVQSQWSTLATSPRPPPSLS